MKLPLEKQIPLAFLVALILLIAISFFSYRRISALGEAVKWEKRTQEVLLKLDNTLSLTVDAETSGRGYVIFGDESFLEPYNHANQVIGENLKELRALTSDNETQTRKVSQLESLINERLSLLRQLIETRRTQPNLTPAAQTSTRGKTVMDEIRDVIAQMKDTEQNLLRQREAELNESINGTYRILLLGSLAGIASLGLANLAIFRETRKRSRAEENLKNANRGLEKRVEQRAAELSAKNEQLNEQIKKREESEERRRVALEAGGLETWKLNLDKADGEPDDRAPALFGLTAADFKGTSKKAFSRIIAEDMSPIDEAFRRAAANKEKFHAEFRIRDAENSIRWNQCAGTPQFDENGNLTHLVGFCRDITENKLAETELKNSEEFNRSIFENSPDCVKVINLDGTLHAMNKNGMCIMEIEDFDLFAGKIWTDFWTGEENKLAVKAVEDARAGKTAHFEGYCKTAKGNLRYWDVTVAPVLDSEGKPRRLISTSRDITERQIAEETLRHSQTRLALALQAGRAGTFEWDIKNDKNLWSPEIEEMYGVPAGTFEGDFESWLKRIAPDDREIVVEEIKSALENTAEECNFEFRVVLPDDSRRWLAARTRFEYDAEQNPLRMVGINVDINEIKEDEAEREKLLTREQAARKDAEIANRLRDEFLATVSHELRAPLNSILGWARLMQQGKLDESTIQKAIQTIVRNAEAQNRLIEDLLDVSRIISGKLRLEVMTIKPISFVESALETVRPAAEAKNITLEVQEDTGISHISGDPNRLQQVVWNLLSNAIKFTPNDGKVSVEIERDNSHIEIRVKDTGVGIKPEFLPYVFDRFSQADASSIRKFGGLGLGLAIVRHLTEMHGGTVHVESAGEGAGSTFTVGLPVIASPLDDETTININQSPPPENNLSLDGLLILVVDDEEDTRQLLVQSLTQYGATVTTANSAETALQAVNNQKPDVLVSDIGMPDEDGYSLIRKVRALEIDIPAVALTAFTRSQDRMRALSAGFQNHVSKPVEPEELATVVASLTGRLQISDAE